MMQRVKAADNFCIEEGSEELRSSFESTWLWRRDCSRDGDGFGILGFMWVRNKALDRDGLG